MRIKTIIATTLIFSQVSFAESWYVREESWIKQERIDAVVGLWEESSDLQKFQMVDYVNRKINEFKRGISKKAWFYGMKNVTEKSLISYGESQHDRFEYSFIVDSEIVGGLREEMDQYVPKDLKEELFEEVVSKSKGYKYGIYPNITCLNSDYGVFNHLYKKGFTGYHTALYNEEISSICRKETKSIEFNNKIKACNGTEDYACMESVHRDVYGVWVKYDI